MDHTALITRQVSAGTLSLLEANILNAYLAEFSAVKGPSSDWVTNHYYQVDLVTRLLHRETGATLDMATTTEYLLIVSVIRNSAHYKPNYRRVLVNALKRFATWHSEMNPGINVQKIKAIQLPASVPTKKDPEAVLTRDEVQQIIDACQNSRDRALIAMLYDGSNRPIELLSLTWGEVHSDQFGLHFETNRKTGIRRHIRLTMAVPYLSQWKSDYPEKPEGSAPVFCVLHRKGGVYGGLKKGALDRIVYTLRDRTGIAKLHPYSFRQSRITHDVEAGFDLQYIMKKNWGTLDTTMIQVYTNLGDDYIDTYALEKAGIKNPAQTEAISTKLNPVECPKCYTLNPPGSDYCSRCGLTISNTAQSRAAALDAIPQDLQRYIKMLQEIEAERDKNPR
jgi:integrase/ribosomal protein L40E